jgi:tetratricopeptide (TPR) repeat protein
VLALRAEDGALAWRADAGPAGKPLSPPVTDGERLFVGARDGLHALSPSDGHELWGFPTERRITAAPVVADGVVYAGCHDHRLHALDGATGRELWRYEAERRIEVSPALAACADPPRPCVLIADRGGTLTAVARPLSAADHEAAGRWVEAASVYADLGQLARGAQLLEDHDEHLKAAELWEAAGERERAAAQYEAAGHWVEAASTYAAAGQPARGVQLLEDHDEPLRAAELWETAGEQERAAAQYEIAGAWARAAELWAGLGRTLKWAEALEQHARSLEGEVCGAKERAAAWEAAAVVFDAEGERERAAAGRREVARCLSQPIISVDVELDKGLMLHAWSRLQFIVRNDGFGPARNLVIRASGNEFEGQVTVTRRIIMLPVGRESIDWLSVRPLEYGDSVPLQVAVEFENQAGETCVLEQAIHVPVARSEADRGEGGVSSLFQPSGGPDYEGGLHRLRDKLTEDAPALLPEFYALEARLLDNLRGERLYGSTETVRAERARVLHALNDLAVRARLGPSFNDLCRR